LSGGDLRVWVHAHVQGSLATEAEAALWSVELGTGEAEVEEDQVGVWEAGSASECAEIAEASSDDGRRRPVGGQRRATAVGCRGISIDPQQAAARCDPFQDQAGVARLPQGAVDRDRPRLGIEQLYYLL